MENKTKEYNEISQELYGCDYDSVNMDQFQQFKVRKIYDEKQGYCWIKGKLKKTK